jgi:hypothetical protein
MPQSPVPVGAADVLGPDDVWVIDNQVQSKREIVRFSNGQWRVVAGPFDQRLLDIDMVDAGEGWAVGDGILLHYRNGEWRFALLPAPLALWDVQMLDANSGWAVGTHLTDDRAVVLRYEGANWQVQSIISDTASFTAIAMWTDGTGYAGDDDARIWRFDGQSWTMVWDAGAEADTSEWVDELALSSPGDGWMVLENGMVGRVQNGLWAFVPSPVGRVSYAARTFDLSLAEDHGWMTSSGRLLRWR